MGRMTHPGNFARGMLLPLMLWASGLSAEPTYTRVSIDADPSWDKVRLIFETKSAPSKKHVTYLSNPSRVQIDLNGRLEGLDTGVYDCEDAYLKSLRIDDLGSSRIRLTALLASSTNGARVDFYQNKAQSFLHIDINRPSRYQQPAWTPRELQLARAKGIPVVVIDPGHGGYDAGALSRLRKSMKEKDVVLDVSRQVVRILRTNGKVYPVMTRSGDYYPTLDERVDLVGETGAGLLVSIHADSAPGNSSASGFAAWILKSSRSDVSSEARKILKYGWRTQLSKLPLSKQNLVISRQVSFVNNETEVAAQTILAGMDRSLQRIAPDFDNRGIKHENLKVLRHYFAPSVLIELGFLSNSSDSRRLEKKVFKDQMAIGIAAGIEAYFEQRERSGGISAPLAPSMKLVKGPELPTPPDFYPDNAGISQVEERDTPSRQAYSGESFEHVVKRGESLGRIAKQYGVEEKDILAASGLPSRRKVLYPGDRLRIPASTSVRPSSLSTSDEPATTHLVAESDNLLTIALRYGTTINRVRELNGWSMDRTLRMGETILVPSSSKPATIKNQSTEVLALEGLENLWTTGAKAAAPPASAGSVQTSAGGGMNLQIYRVQAGDTLSSIADKYNSEMRSLRVLNGLKSDLIRVGQELKVPVPRSTSTISQPGSLSGSEQLAEHSGVLIGERTN